MGGSKPVVEGPAEPAAAAAGGASAPSTSVRRYQVPNAVNLLAIGEYAGDEAPGGGDTWRHRDERRGEPAGRAEPLCTPPPSPSLSRSGSTSLSSARRLPSWSPARERATASARKMPKRYSLAAQYRFDERKELYAEVPYITALLTYAMYAMMIIIGHVRDSVRKMGRWLRQPDGEPSERAPLLADFEDFYTRRMYRRIEDCWSRPICSKPGAHIDVVERRFRTRAERQRLLQQQWLKGERHASPEQLVELHMHETGEYRGLLPQTPCTAAQEYTGQVRRCLNLSSYNYLGYAEVPGGIGDSVLQALERYGVSVCAARDGGFTAPLRQLEETVARFVGKEAAIVVGMGFATNSMILPALVGKGGLLVSDELNHASIVAGARSSGAKIRVFRHNDAKDLERVLRSSIAEGQPRTHRPWTKVLVVVEGIYSMEGAVCNLPEILRVTHKYRAYLFVDEAHSIGALGATGRGVCEYTGVNAAEVDVLMGTFTKSFGAVGGYVAGSAELVRHLRHASAGALHTTTMSPSSAMQILYAMRQISGEDGTDVGRRKIAQLRDNSLYFRRRLIELGVQTIGTIGSPVVPIMLYIPSKIAAFSRECLRRGLAIVVVGFPATPLILSRARICLSAAHTRADLDFALQVIDEVADLLLLKYSKHRLNGKRTTDKAKGR
ncbi:hypothetical protein CDCA_CDCA09G2807 [Cyanidium caldarium]|uniref:serine C-palmitoyltransferase n=1 Tax=Cyanidium caldarium TaxID=2771 RepID=A0AAV9IWY8_CYACA|nr:hypothetical protein CDCA_CDCA09G2807 [Cyanidium caldarium]